MTRDMWNGDPIFRLGGTSYVAMTDAVKQRIDAIAPSNVRFEPIPAR